MDVSVVAIRRTTMSIDEEGNTVRNEQVVFPGAGDALQESDIVLVVGKNDSLAAFKELKR